MKCCQINDGWLAEERGWREDGERMERGWREDGERGWREDGERGWREDGCMMSVDRGRGELI